MVTDNGLSQIQKQIMWDRLISVVEEQAQTLLRTAFSTIVREAGDLSAGVFDLKGRMLAQAVTGTPGPRQLDGGVGQALHPSLPAGDDARRRRLHLQRPLDGHGTPERLRPHHAVLPEGQAGRAVLLHQPPHGHRRHRVRPGRVRRVHGGPLHPDAEAGGRRHHEPHAPGDDPGQHAAARRHHRRRLLARQLQRHRLPAAGRDDGRVRARRPGRARRAHLPTLRARGARGDRPAAERELALRDDPGRLRRADHAGGHHHRVGHGHPRRLHGHFWCRAARHQRAHRLHPQPTRASASPAWWRRGSRTTRARSCLSR